MIWAWLLIIIGLVLLVAEIFVPSYGIISIVALTCIIVGVTMIFFAPVSEGGGVTMGLLALLAVMITIPGIVAAGFHFWPKTPFGKQMFLPGPDADDEIAALPDAHHYDHLLGQVGKTITMLRPSGIVLIQGRRVDTKTEGLFVDVGQWVRVIDVRPGQVIVRPLDADELNRLPDDLTNS